MGIEFAAEYGGLGGAFLTQYIPDDYQPRGKKAAMLWVEGFSAIFRVIHEIFAAGEIPPPIALLEALCKLPRTI